MSERASRLGHILAELKRRKVYHVAALYAAVGWAISVAAPDLSGALLLPDWTPRLVIALLVIGFPVALVLAWALEITPQGVRRTGSPRPPDSTAEEGAVEAMSVTEAREDAKSIAVLPFANLSPDPESEYFSDGMTEEIINTLSQLKDLRVAARTSSFAFKGKTPDMTEIAQKLKVATVLEGSVRKAGNRLRITAQLISVADGYHLWSDRYDRELDDVFALQDDIARRIAERLQVSLASEEAPLVRPPTENVVAYDLYLKGRFQQRQHGEGARRALEYFERALALDPDFAHAHVGLADAYVLLSISRLPPKETMPKARAAAERALEIDDSLAEAHLALAWVRMHWDFDAKSAERHFLRAIELDPRLAEAHSRYAQFLLTLRGPSEAAEAAARRAVELEPLAEPVHSWLGLVLWISGRAEEAIQQLQHAVELDPTSYHAHHLLSHAYLLNSMYPEAIAAAETAMALAGRHPWSLGVVALARLAVGDQSEAEAILDELLERSRTEYIPSTIVAGVYAVSGREDEAFAALDRAYEERDGLITILKFWTALDSYRFHTMRRDPRFDALLKRVGYWETETTQ